MGLSRVERARISDSRLRIKSVEHSLKHVDPKKVENYDAIRAKTASKAEKQPA